MTTLSIDVASSYDDGRENSSGLINRNLAEIYLYSNSNSYAAIRFQNVTIPPGASIDTAIVRMVASASVSGTDLVHEVSCHDADDSTEILTSSYNISGRDRTSAVALWTLPAITSGSAYDTVDFAAALQEVISRPGWSSGNSVMVIFRRYSASETGDKRFYSYDNGSNVPQLRVTYTDEEESVNLALLLAEQLSGGITALQGGF